MRKLPSAVSVGHATDGQPIRPHCGGADAYHCRRFKDAPRFRFRAYVHGFHASRAARYSPALTQPLRCYLAAIAIFCNWFIGKSALAHSRDLNLSYNCAFLLLHTLREAMAAELKRRVIGSAGNVAELHALISAVREAHQSAIIPRRADILAADKPQPIEPLFIRQPDGFRCVAHAAPKLTTAA